MMGRKLRFCVAVLTLLMLLVAAPTETEAAKKKKKKTAKPTQQTAQIVNPVGRYEKAAGEEGFGWIKIKWADKKKTYLKVEAEGGYHIISGVRTDGFEGKGRLEGNRAEFYESHGRRLVLEFNGNRLRAQAVGDDWVEFGNRINGNYVRQKTKRKK